MPGIVFRTYYDLPNLGMNEQDMRCIEEEPSHTRLGTLNPEFLGLSCFPGHLVRNPRSSIYVATKS